MANSTEKLGWKCKVCKQPGDQNVKVGLKFSDLSVENVWKSQGRSNTLILGSQRSLDHFPSFKTLSFLIDLGFESNWMINFKTRISSLQNDVITSLLVGQCLTHFVYNICLLSKQKCRQCRQCGTKTTSRWHIDYTLCDKCYQNKHKTNRCPLCNEEQGNQKVIQCDSCSRYARTSSSWPQLVVEDLITLTWNVSPITRRLFIG